MSRLETLASIEQDACRRGMRLPADMLASIAECRAYTVTGKAKALEFMAVTRKFAPVV